jgi:hypothetical protein
MDWNHFQEKKTILKISILKRKLENIANIIILIVYLKRIYYLLNTNIQKISNMVNYVNIVLFDDYDNRDLLILYDKEKDIFIVKKWKRTYLSDGYCGEIINLFIYNAKEIKVIYNHETI